LYFTRNDSKHIVVDHIVTRCW